MRLNDNLGAMVKAAIAEIDEIDVETGTLNGAIEEARDIDLTGIQSAIDDVCDAAESLASLLGGIGALGDRLTILQNATFDISTTVTLEQLERHTKSVSKTEEDE